MQCQFALLADSVNETKEGKLNILGTFDRLWVRSLPAQHGHMVLVAGFTGVFADIGDHQVTIHVVQADTDDDAMPPIELPKVTMRPRGPGKTPRARLLLNLNGFPIPGIGQFEFRIRVGGVLMAIVPLEIAQQS